MEYAYRGARAMVLLHERNLRDFVERWKECRRAGLPMPPSNDEDYASFEMLLRHVLGCARHYLVWMCEQLRLPDPAVDPVPDAGAIAAEADRYLEHVLDRWRAPLAGVPEEAFYKRTYTSRWGVDYCIDAMLEHAVMHPIRHRFQLDEWLARHRGPSPALSQPAG